MKTIDEFLSHLRSLDVEIWAEGVSGEPPAEARLRYRAPEEILTPALLEQLREHKTEILAFLQQANTAVKSDLPTILPASRNGNLPLSFAQQRLWFLEQLEPGSSAYNMPAAYRLTGALNVTALEQSLNEIVRRHEILRTSFPSVEGQPHQVIAANLPLTLSMLDLQGLSTEEREVEVNRQALFNAQQPFDLAQGPLFRVKLLRLADDDHVLLLNMHHIISDGWSFNVFFRELAALYTAFSSGKPSPLSELSIQYADFAVWQRQWLQGEVLQSQLDYWKQKLSGSLPVLELPIDYPRPSIQTYRGAYQYLVLSQNLMDALKSLSQEAGVTLFMTLLAAFQILLYRYSGQEDIIVGTPIAGRNQLQTEGLIGFFVNSLVLRADLSGNPSFRELLTRVREVALGAYAHQDLPLEKLVEELQPERDRSRSPLLQIMFALQNASSATLELPGLIVNSLSIDGETAKFALTLSMKETDQGLKASWEYNTDLFKPETIARMIGHFQVLLEGIVANPEQCLSDLPLLTLAEQHQLLVEWNNTQTDYPNNICIHQLFEAQVERTPDAIAVVFENQQLTYQQLNHRANQLAHYLQKLGVKPEVLVGICLERSPLMLVGLLGILKAGGAYVPLDPDYPAERLADLLEDTQVPVLLTQQSLVEKLPANQAQSLCLDTDWDKINYQDEDNPTCKATADNLAYVTYTSGSTGKPKGVCAIHRGVVRLVKGIDYANLNSEETFLQLAPISFDASTFEIWGSLLNGARLAIFSPHPPSLEELGQAIRRYQVTTLWLTAGLFHLMVDERLEDLKPLRQLLAGGDVLSVSHVQKFLQEQGDCQLINGYGPTENTTFTCCYRILETSQLDNSVPIGRPIANTQIYILDRHLNPVPIGVPGELYIGGDGLARGYLNRPELTEEKFILNPFEEAEGRRQEAGGGKLYKTGDLVRYLPDGNIEFLGRLDNQVKIRGFRIELGEIEAALSQHPTIKQAVVISREDTPGDKRLVAYLVPNDPSSIQNPKSKIQNQLRDFLKEKLPDYMIPSAFAQLDSFPLTPNGKIDRRALPAPDQTRLEPKGTFVAPRDELERQLTKIWEKVLGIQPIGVKDNFFDLGGHSLLAVKLFAQIEKTFQTNLPLTTLFQGSTVEELAHIIIQERKSLSQASLLSQSVDSSHWRSLVAIKPEGSKPPMFFVHAAGGGLVYYRNFAEYLGSEQPFYGLESSGLDGRQVAHTTVEDMAEHYIEEIRNIQTEGPYYLGGLSFGGLLAFEIAQQLHAQGQKVALLALFDTYAPGSVQRLPIQNRLSSHWTTFRQSGLKYIFKKSLNKAKWVRNRLQKNLQKFELKLQYYLQYSQGKPLPYAVRHNYVKDIHNNAVRRYTPKVYPAKITLFRASIRNNSEGYYIDPSLGWDKLAGGGLEIHDVPGNHYSMIREPHVQVLAKKLRNCMDKVF